MWWTYFPVDCWHSYGYKLCTVEFIKNIGNKITKVTQKLAKQFNLTFTYMYMSLNNSEFSNSIHLILPNELDVKDTTDSTNSASHLDLQLKYDNHGKIQAKVYDKRDDSVFFFTFPYQSSCNVCGCACQAGDA